jgi:hypothetical protein
MFLMLAVMMLASCNGQHRRVASENPPTVAPSPKSEPQSPSTPTDVPKKEIPSGNDTLAVGTAGNEDEDPSYITPPAEQPSCSRHRRGGYPPCPPCPPCPRRRAHRELCYACNGSGVCPVCHGLGEYNVGIYTGKYEPRPCGYCYGTGRCPKCWGEGILVEYDYY